MELNDGLSISVIQSGARAKHLDNQDSTLCYAQAQLPVFSVSSGLHLVIGTLINMTGLVCRFRMWRGVLVPLPS